MSEKNGKQTQNLSLNAAQLGTMLVLDAQLASLQVGANQLGGFLKLEREANILVSAMHQIQRDKELLMKSWASQVQVFPPSALPPSQQIIPGK